jgi:predicted Holliday junction resolvase-like endonuclease
VDLTTSANEIIQSLSDRGLYAVCPCCDRPVQLRDCGLFYLDDFTPQAKQVHEQLLAALKERLRELKERRRQIPARSEVGARAVNMGFILERIAPSLDGFRFDRNDCRSIFDPIDYVIFEGLKSKGSVSRIIFADIKTGKASLQSNQKEIRTLIGSKKVSMMTYSPDHRKS